MTRRKPEPFRTPPVLSLGDRLVMARKRVHLNQWRMAERMGVSRHSISKWERGVVEPRLGDAVRWAEVTGVPLVWLATGHNPRYDHPPSEPG